MTTKKSTKPSGAVNVAASAENDSADAASISATPVAPKAAKQLLPIPPKAGLKYGEKDLKVFKENIEKSRDEALEELRFLKERLEDLTSSESNEDSSIYSMHMAEQGSEAIEKEKTYAQIQRIQDYLRKLDEALTRIAEKSYGICRMCGILIARERLLAVPITTLSASYKIHQRCPDDGVDRIVAKGGAALK
ncbi:MAG: hypothetical protein MUC47_05500 [Candidatus Kapabacteria bacterium]|nr:hypothetical protein [Candidatus Kapabacteria bacterium]